MFFSGALLLFKCLTLAGYFLRLETLGLSTCYPLTGNPLVVQWLRLDTLTAKSGSVLVRELRSHKPYGMDKKTHTQTNKKHPVQVQRHFELPRSYTRSFLVGHGETLEGALHVLSPIFTPFIYIFNQECFMCMHFMYEA